MEVKFKETYEQRKAIKWKKFLWRVVRDRKKMWYSDYEALYLPKYCKSLISYNWKECSKCKKFKVWAFFSKSKHSSTWYSCDCLECRQGVKKVLRSDLNYRQKENEYKKQRRETKRWEMILKLDNIYYRDKQIIENRKIINKFKKISKKQATINKIDYLVSKWYDLDKMCKLYNISAWAYRTQAYKDNN